MAKEFRLPDLGSGLKEGEIISWLVKVGDEVTDEDLLCEVETEKAVIEVPVPFNGTVLSLAADVGELVKVGAVLAVFGEAGELSEAPDEAAPESAATQAGTPPSLTRSKHIEHLRMRGLALSYSNLGMSKGQETMQ